MIHPDLPRFYNSGYLFTLGDTTVFHPGDALTVPEQPVDVLCVPVCAPWMRAAEGDRLRPRRRRPAQRRDPRPDLLRGRAPDRRRPVRPAPARDPELHPARRRRRPRRAAVSPRPASRARGRTSPGPRPAPPRGRSRRRCRSRRTAGPCRRTTSAERRAMPHSPSPVVSIQPTGPAYRPRSMPSISEISRTASAVGVPPTAADGCSDAARWSDDTVPASWTTPATSVARCMTLGRWSTNGASGTFIDEQCGSSASATERTAYSCSSRSLLDRARVAARARSRSSAPVRRMVPASTREVTRPRSRRTSISGVAPNMPVDVEGPAHRVASRPAARAASGRRSVRRRSRPGRGPARPSPGRPPRSGVRRRRRPPSSARCRARRRRRPRPRARPARSPGRRTSRPRRRSRPG